MIKVDNINKLIDHVNGIDEHIPNWLSDHCLYGMINQITNGKYCDNSTIGAIEDFTGASDINAYELSYRYDREDDIGSRPLDEQKANIIHALTTLRDTGRGVWLW